jgi:hypothetical protein
VNRLINSSRHGAYSYSERGSQTGTWDNSNSQYGLLGVWSGAEVGAEVPQSYWLQVQNHWYECQNVGGDWGYLRAGSGSGTLSMTVAGLASLFVTHDQDEAVELVLETVEALFREREDNLWGSMVKQTLKRKRPNFSETFYGYRTFNQLLEDAQRRGLLELQKDDKSGGYLIISFGPAA